MHGCRRPAGLTFALLAVCLCFALPGCHQEAEIQQYLIPKDEVVQQIGRRKLAAKDRMLVAMFREANQGWFFKLAGPNDQVTQQTDAFHQLVDSVRFAQQNAGQPDWKLPAGWRQQAGGGSMRFATLKIPGSDPPLELTVVPLGITHEDEQQYLLENLNRWRGQMQLPPIAKQALPAEIEKRDVAGRQAIVMDMVGNLQSVSRILPPRLAGRRSAPGRPGSRPARTGPPVEGHDPSVLACQPPSGWRPLRLGLMDKALYEVRDGERQIAISVRSAGGQLLDNINRWRDQVRLAPISAERLAAELQPFTVDDHEGKYIEISGPSDAAAAESIYGVVVDVAGRRWFVKMQGNAQLAVREKDNFRAFAASLRFTPG